MCNNNLFYRFGDSSFRFLYVYPTAIDALINAEGSTYSIYRGKAEFAPKTSNKLRMKTYNPLVVQSLDGVKPLMNFSKFCGRLSLNYWNEKPHESIVNFFHGNSNKIVNDLHNEEVFMKFYFACIYKDDGWKYLREPLLELINRLDNKEYLDRQLKLSFVQNR